MLSEADLDAEIARYTQILQQMDVLEMDLQHLDDFATATSIHCRQAEAHTPRASPEIMP
jgi:Tat protein secretion system quality control protein TatD with DNase activity